MLPPPELLLPPPPPPQAASSPANTADAIAARASRVREFDAVAVDMSNRPPEQGVATAAHGRVCPTTSRRFKPRGAAVQEASARFQNA
jgi:hypothetical protein